MAFFNEDDGGARPNEKAAGTLAQSMHLVVSWPI
jgi:hypothetical protein